MRTIAIAKRILIELIRDKRTLTLIFIAPIVIMWLMNAMFSANSSTEVSLATVNVPLLVRKNLDKVKEVSVTKYKKYDSAKTALKNQKVDGVIYYHKQKYFVTYANTDAAKTTMTKQALKAAITGQKVQKLVNANIKLQLALQAITHQKTKKLKQSSPKIENHYQYGNSNTNFFAKIIPVLMGFFIFFFVFLISGMGLLNERIKGTLDRLLATPVKRSEIVYGYMISYGILSIVQSIIIVLATIWLLKVEVVGNIFSIILISLLFTLVALSFGILMSTLANSEFQMMQFIPLVVIPQLFFSGILPVDSMINWAQYISKVLPLTYAGDALTKIMMNGTEITQLGNDILALLIFLVVLVCLNIIGLKRYRKV